MFCSRNNAIWVDLRLLCSSPPGEPSQSSPARRYGDGMSRIVKVFVLVGALLSAGAPAAAATLTLTDLHLGTETIWTLTVQTGCATCDVTLTALFKDPDGAGSGTNAYDGKWLDSVQWAIGSDDDESK